MPPQTKPRRLWESSGDRVENLTAPPHLALQRTRHYLCLTAWPDMMVCNRFQLSEAQTQTLHHNYDFWTKLPSISLHQSGHFLGFPLDPAKLDDSGQALA